jgi:cytochrome c556
MSAHSRALPAFAATLGLALVACTETPQPSPTAAPPTTPVASATPAATDPLEIIEARRALMTEAERQIKPIDLYTVGTPADPEALRSAAVTIESLLLALPHLFPPATNLFDPAAHDPLTTALPSVWENFAAFEQLAANAERAAATLAAADGEPALQQAARNLRAACDACHAGFMKPYVPPQATDEDRDFDFDQFLKK